MEYPFITTWLQAKSLIKALLLQSNWSQTSDAPITQVEKETWDNYRQELKNITTDQINSLPTAIIWPDSPSDIIETCIRKEIPDPAERIRKKYAKQMKHVVASYGDEERETWATQVKEAEAWEADNNAVIPMLTNIATERGITVAELVIKVKENDILFRTVVGKILGKQQKELDEL